MRLLLYRGLLALSAWSLAMSSAAVAPPPSSIKIPWGEIFTALQESNLGPEDMRDLQSYMQERIREQQLRQQQKRQQQPAAPPPPPLPSTVGDDAATAAAAGGDDDAAAPPSPAAAAPPPPLVESASTEAGDDAGGAFDWKATLAAFKEQARVLDRSVALRKAGNERLAAGDVEGARASYREAIKALEEGTVVATGRTRRCGHSCRLNLAVAATREGDLAGARAVYGAILAEGEEKVEAAVRLQCWTKRARIARRLGEVEAALADLTAANKLRPGDAKIRQELEEMGGTPVEPPPPAPASPLDALFGGGGAGGDVGGLGGGLFGDGLLSGLGAGGGGGGGGGGGDLLGGLLSSALGSGVGGAGGAGGGGANPLEHLVGDYISSMGARLVDLLEEPQTLQMACSLAKRLEPGYLRSLAQTANLPLGDGAIDWLHAKATSLEPEDLRRWVQRGKFAHRTYGAAKRTWAGVQPLLRPARLLAMYLMVLRWVAACLLPTLP